MELIVKMSTCQCLSILTLSLQSWFVNMSMNQLLEKSTNRSETRKGSEEIKNKGSKIKKIFQCYIQILEEEVGT